MEERAVNEQVARTSRPEERFQSLADDYLSRPGVSLGRIFHNEGLKVNGKIFAMVVRGRLVVKVPARQTAELVASGEGTAFEPGPGRKMREWVMVEMTAGTEGSRRWSALMEDAYAYGVALTKR